MFIRRERKEDREAVYRVVREAFASAEESDGTEQDLVAALRKSPDFLPALSLVAEEEGEIIGHILFSRAYVGACPVLALAPLSVLPAYQRRGVGLALMERGHAAARELGMAIRWSWAIPPTIPGRAMLRRSATASVLPSRWSWKERLWH